MARQKSDRSTGDVTRPSVASEDEDGSTTVITDRSLISWPSPSAGDDTCDVLMVTRGPETGRMYILDGPTRLGRAPVCGIHVNDSSISRVHAVLARERDGSWLLEDTGSSNGTFVDGERIKRHVLQDGDQFQLGVRVSFQFARMQRSQVNLMRSLYESSVQDALTGVANRRHLETRLRKEVAFGTRHGTDFALLMIDVDHFKGVNDTFGHDVGDEVLKSLAQTMRAQIRLEDFFARYGGEEFVVVAPGIAIEGAMMLAERLRSVVDRMPVKVGTETLHITVSVGVATFDRCGRPRDSAEVLKPADKRLYRAKRAGRNRVVGPG